MKDLWDSVLKRLSHELSETTINTWFDEVTVVTMEDSAFVLHCSNTFKKSTIEARFLPHIKAALRDLFSTDLEVKILDDQQLAAYHGVAPDRPGDLSESEAFTFETYVVGPQNKLAFAAAKAVTEKPGENYNPLFIYGDSGLGKTHLLYAIANALRKKRPEARIVYVKGDDFTNELKAKLDAIAAGATKVEASETNGNIKINGTETQVYKEPTDVVHGAVATDGEVTEMLNEVFTTTSV